MIVCGWVTNRSADGWQSNLLSLSYSSRQHSPPPAHSATGPATPGTAHHSPRDLLSRANSRSPCSTLISTLVWPSAAVEKTSFLEVGSVVLRGMTLVATPPRVSRPRDRGVTSSSTMSLTCAGGRTEGGRGLGRGGQAEGGK